jgi:hypothetical protein
MAVQHRVFACSSSLLFGVVVVVIVVSVIDRGNRELSRTWLKLIRKEKEEEDEEEKERRSRRGKMI